MRTACGSAPSRSTTGRSSRPSASCSRPRARVAFSGDTTVCDDLVRRPRASICWCTSASSTARCWPGPHARRQGLANVAAYHTLSSEVGKVAAGPARACSLLNHFVPVEFDRDALLREVCADFAGPVVIGEDLLTVDVPRRVIYRDLRLGLALNERGC